MSWIEDIKNHIKNSNIRVVFPEPTDIRVLQAAENLTTNKLCKIILVGNKKLINSAAKANKISLNNIEIITPESFDRKDEFIEKYFELRKEKGITVEQASTIMMNPLYFGAMLVACWDADCYVGGCANPTSEIIRATIQTIQPEKGIKTISSSTIHILHNQSFGEEGIMFFSDPGVIPDPTAEQLADIAISAAKKWELIMRVPAKVAMLSFSTKGSAKHPNVDKVIKATQIAQEKAPNFIIDGELQLDAAVMPEIAKRKAPGSLIEGKANVLVFPDLNAGNIAYKLIERLGDTTAYGPILQGMSKPCSDLSRGCSANDIIDVTAIVAAETISMLHSPS